MAHIWVYEESQWAVLPLDGALFSLGHRRPRARSTGSNAPRDYEKDVLIMSVGEPSKDSWVLLAGPGSEVHVNGARIRLGVRCVRDCDEIRVAGAGLFYFSTERLAAVEPFAGSSSNAFCPRCRQEIASGQPSVKCPACGVWYHQSEDFPCWTYSETCALCPQTTSMEGGYRWMPEEI